MTKVRTRCMSCEAPIQFRPGAGSRLCPFCGSVNLVREQLISVPEIELKTDGVFRLLGRGRLEKALEQAELALEAAGGHTRLDFYRACTLFELGRSQEAVYLLIDLTGTEAPVQLRADIHAKLAEALLSTDRLDEAEESTNRAQELLEGHPTARFIQARILMKRGELVSSTGAGRSLFHPTARFCCSCWRGFLSRAINTTRRSSPLRISSSRRPPPPCTSSPRPPAFWG